MLFVSPNYPSSAGTSRKQPLPGLRVLVVKKRHGGQQDVRHVASDLQQTRHMPGENQDCCFLSCSTGPGVSLQVLPPARRVVCPWYSKPELSMSVAGLQKQTPCLLLVFKNRLRVCCWSSKTDSMSVAGLQKQTPCLLLVFKNRFRVCSWSLSMLKRRKKNFVFKTRAVHVFKTRAVHVCSWSSKPEMSMFVPGLQNQRCPCLFLVFKRELSMFVLGLQNQSCPGYNHCTANSCE